MELMDAEKELNEGLEIVQRAAERMRRALHVESKQADALNSEGIRTQEELNQLKAKYERLVAAARALRAYQMFQGGELGKIVYELDAALATEPELALPQTEARTAYDAAVGELMSWSDQLMEHVDGQYDPESDDYAVCMNVEMELTRVRELRAKAGVK